MRVTSTVNGERHEVDDVWEGESLLYVLRERMGLPGSKNACEQGECGSCTVYLDGVAGRAPAWSPPARPRAASRAPSRGSRDGDDLHPVQQAFVEAGAVQCGFCTPGPARADARPARAPATPPPSDPEIREALAGNLCRCTGYEKILDAVRLAADRMATQARGRATAMSTVVIDGAHVVTVDAAPAPSTRPGTSSSRATGSPRSAPDRRPRRRTLDGARQRSTAPAAWSRPGFVNTHHHLYQWVTRGLAVDATLFEWLTTLYPVWGRHRRATSCGRAATGALGWLAQTGCTTDAPTTTTCSRATAATCSAPRSRRPGAVGLRFHPTRGSMDLGQSQGGLPPDDVVEDIDAILAATEAAIDALPRPVARLDAADRRRALLAVLGDRRAADARPPSWPAAQGRPAAHPPVRDARRGGVLPRALRLHAGRVHGVRRLARPGRLVRARRAPRRRRRSPRWPRPAPASRTARRPTPGSAPGIARARDLRDAGRARRARRRRRRVATRRARCSRRCGTRCCSPGPAAARGR